MNRDDIIRLALDANLLNYVDLETPRRYFICADADVEEVERFAALVTAEKDKEIERLREALHDISISQNSMYQEARAKQALGEDQNIWRMCGLNTDDVIKMADEAGIVMSLTDERVTLSKLNRFLELHLKALKNEGYRQCAKGQRTTQFCGLLDAAVKEPLTDEEIDAAIAKERDALLEHLYGPATDGPGVDKRVRKLARAAINAAIRARGE
jgi:hypothetical protein